MGIFDEKPAGPSLMEQLEEMKKQGALKTVSPSPSTTPVTQWPPLPMPQHWPTPSYPLVPSFSPGTGWSEQALHDGFDPAVSPSWKYCALCRLDALLSGPPELPNQPESKIESAEQFVVNPIGTYVESFIEDQLYAALRRACISFVTQHEVDGGRYRLDFAVPSKMLGIEAEGHAAHSTQDARERDARRVVDLQILGWRVLPFTGSDIKADADGCARRVVEMLEKL